MLLASVIAEWGGVLRCGERILILGSVGALTRLSLLTFVSGAKLGCRSLRLVVSDPQLFCCLSLLAIIAIVVIERPALVLDAILDVIRLAEVDH